MGNEKVVQIVDKKMEHRTANVCKLTINFMLRIIARMKWFFHIDSSGFMLQF